MNDKNQENESDAGGYDIESSDNDAKTTVISKEDQDVDTQNVEMKNVKENPYYESIEGAKIDIENTIGIIIQ